MITLESFISRPLLVYGAGAIARVIFPYLLHNKQLTLLGAAVTENAEKCDLTDLGISVRNISDWREYADTAIILIATSEQYHAAITETCRRYGFFTIVPLTVALKDEIIQSYYMRFFADKGIFMDGSDFAIGKMCFVNPLRRNISNGINLFSQIGDLVLPGEYDDWRMVVEGPYDWGWTMLQAGDIVLDCGANMGVFSVYAASKGCLSYAFEPTPALQPILEEHSHLNGGNIVPVPCAVSDQDGEATFHIDPYSSGGSSLLVRSSGTKKITVQQLTLDTFIKQEGLDRVDFIKADIEGAERLMIAGAQEILSRFAPKLSLCTYHLPDDKEVLTNLILEANPNYHISYRWQKLYAYV